MYHVHGVNAPIAKGAISVQVSKTPHNYFDGKDWCLLVSDSGGWIVQSTSSVRMAEQQKTMAPGSVGKSPNTEKFWVHTKKLVRSFDPPSSTHSTPLLVHQQYEPAGSAVENVRKSCQALPSLILFYAQELPELQRPTHSSNPHSSASCFEEQRYWSPGAN